MVEGNLQVAVCTTCHRCSLVHNSINVRHLLQLDTILYNSHMKMICSRFIGRLRPLFSGDSAASPNKPEYRTIRQKPHHTPAQECYPNESNPRPGFDSASPSPRKMQRAYAAMTASKQRSASGVDEPHCHEEVLVSGAHLPRMHHIRLRP